MATKSLPERVSVLEEMVFKNPPQELAAFRADVDARFDRVDARFDALDRALREQGAQLSSQMRMLYEDLIERIKTIKEGRDVGEAAPAQPARRKPKR